MSEIEEAFRQGRTQFCPECMGTGVSGSRIATGAEGRHYRQDVTCPVCRGALWITPAREAAYRVEREESEKRRQVTARRTRLKETLNAILGIVILLGIAVALGNWFRITAGGLLLLTACGLFSAVRRAKSEAAQVVLVMAGILALAFGGVLLYEGIRRATAAPSAIFWQGGIGPAASASHASRSAAIGSTRMARGAGR